MTRTNYSARVTDLRIVGLTLLAGGAGAVCACAGSSAVAGSSWKTQIKPHQFQIYSPIWPKMVQQTLQAPDRSDENYKPRTLTLRALARVHFSGDVEVSLREMWLRLQSQLSQCCECHRAGVSFYSVPGTTAPGAKMRLSRCSQARSKRLPKSLCTRFG